MNLLEYGLGSDPLVADSPASGFTASIQRLALDQGTNRYFMIHACRNLIADDAEFVVEVSDTLTPWQPLPTVLVDRERSTGTPGKEIRVYRGLTPAAASRQYARLRIYLHPAD